MNRSLRRVCLAALVVLLIASVAAAQNLPTPKQLIAKYVEAIGGEKAIRATTSMSTKGVMEMPAMGMSGAVEIAVKAPNRMLMTMEMPSVGTITTGFDGEVAWMDNPMTGAMLLEGDQLKDLMKQADFYTDLRYDEHYPTQETVEQTEFAGVQAYKVKLVDPDGKELFEYFAVESGLKVGFEGEQTSEMGTVFVTTELTDYKEIDGRMMPMTNIAKMMGMEIKMVFEDVHFDGVEEAIFALPANIKTLVAAKQ